MKRQSTVFERYEKFIKAGRSRGRGADYKPGVGVRDVQSTGLSHRIKGWKTGRVHHFLSNMELNYFYMLEWNLYVSDIREKFLLPPNHTIDIAERLNIKHPKDLKRKQPAIMSTDFLLNVRINDETTKLFARSIIPKYRLSMKRTIEILELERMYWSERSIDWGIVTEDEINAILARNVAWLHKTLDLSSSPGVSADLLAEVEPKLFQELTSRNLPFPKSARNVDVHFNLKTGTCLWMVRHLIANRVWKIDMTAPIDLSQPLNIVREEKIAEIRRSLIKNYVDSQVRYRVD